MTAVVAPAVGAAVEDCRKKQKKYGFLWNVQARKWFRLVNQAQLDRAIFDHSDSSDVSKSFFLETCI